MNAINAEQVDLIGAMRYRRGREDYLVQRMNEPFLVQTIIGRKKYPAGHLLVAKLDGTEREAVAPYIFEKTFHSKWPNA